MYTLYRGFDDGIMIQWTKFDTAQTLDAAMELMSERQAEGLLGAWMIQDANGEAVWQEWN